jgi:iron complex outermembrane recepter protein
MTKRLSMLGLALCSAISSLALAQTEGAPAALDEIVVTAQKRSESIQKVPLAVSAFSADQLQKSGVTDLSSLGAMAPDVNMGEQNGGARITIRGIGLQANGPGSEEAPVAYNQDGVYIARTAGAMMGFFDLNDVEVLRGPQGTLYGRNATGGAVDVNSKDPTNTSDGYVRLTAGTYAHVGTEGAIGGAITDNINGRIAFLTNDHDGYGTNITTGNPIDTQHERAVRLKLEFLPADGLRILWSADYATANDSYGAAWHVIGHEGPQTVPTGVLLGGVVATSIRDVANEYDPQRQVSAWGTGVTVTYNLGFAELKSITAYRDTNIQTRNDVDGTSFQLFSPETEIEDGRQISEELQLTGKADRLDWQVGLYYYHERLYAINAIPYYNSSFLSQGYFAGSNMATDAAATFGQITYHLTDAWSVTLGGRESTERKSVVNQNSFNTVTPAGSFPYSPNTFNVAYGGECSQAVQTDPATCVPSKRWTAFTPKFGIQYQATENALIYASATKGFRSGTYSLGNVDQGPVNPEMVWSYETGLKAKFFDNRLTSNLALFDYDYSNLQVTKNEGTLLVLENAASARVKGFEAELVGRPTDQIRLDFSGSYLDARFTNYVSSDPNRPEGDGTTFIGTSPAFDLKGNYLPQSPKVSFLAGAEYSVDKSIGSFTPRIEAAYSSRIFFDAFNTAEMSLPAKTRYNASLNYLSSDGKWTASVVGRNLANKVQATNAYVASSLVGSIINADIEPPRTIDVTVGYKF